MVKLHVLSDLHLEFAPFTLPSVEADALILAGDIGSGLLGARAARRWAHGRPVVYTAGNHEFYGRKFPGHLEDLKASSYPATFLEDTSYVLYSPGNVETRILGCTLWTDFELYGPVEYVKSMQVAERGMNDYWEIRHDDGRNLHPFDTRQTHDKSVEWLRQELAKPWQGKTVVVTHHVPSTKSISPTFKNSLLNPAFVSNLEYLMSGVDLWIHGHTHTAFDYMIGNCRVVCNPRGYPNEGSRGFSGKKFDAKLVIEL